MEIIIKNLLIRTETWTSSDLSSWTCLCLLPRNQREKTNRNGHLLQRNHTSAPNFIHKTAKSSMTPANSSAVSLQGVGVCACVAQMSSLSRCHHVTAHKLSNRAAGGILLAHNCTVESLLHRYTIAILL